MSSRVGAKFDIDILEILESSLWMGLCVPILLSVVDFFKYYMSDLDTGWIALYGYYLFHLFWLCWIPIFYKMMTTRIEKQKENVVLNVLMVDE